MSTLQSNPDKKELRNFGLVIGAMTGVMFGLVLPLLFDRDFPRWPWMAAAVLLAWALSAPATLKHLHHLWMTVGQALGWINTRIILGIMFFLIILPVGLVRKLSGRDPMERSLTGEKKSYRVTSAVPDKKHMERPY